jgi:hypothetical protein
MLGSKEGLWSRELVRMLGSKEGLWSRELVRMLVLED